jgi:hypothetical protein
MINNLSLSTPVATLAVNGKKTVVIFIAGVAFGCYLLYSLQSKYGILLPANKIKNR